MKELLRTTWAYKTMRKGVSRATLVLFSDEKYLRPLLKLCAKAFFGAKEGSRTARLIEAEQYADCLFFPEEGGKLTVDMCARMLEESMLRPVEGARRLFVLDGFQNATALVQNKLLKLLEEPPEGTYFLLGATREYSVLPTVLSRVSVISENPFPDEAVEAALARMYPGRQVHEAAVACGGKLSVAESLFAGGGEDFLLAERFLLGEDRELLCRSLGEKKNGQAFLSALKLVLWDAMLIAICLEQFAVRPTEATKKIAAEMPAAASMAAMDLVTKAERDISLNANISQCALALGISIDKEKETWQKLLR